MKEYELLELILAKLYGEISDASCDCDNRIIAELFKNGLIEKKKYRRINKQTDLLEKKTYVRGGYIIWTSTV